MADKKYIIEDGYLLIENMKLDLPSIVDSVLQKGKIIIILCESNEDPTNGRNVFAYDTELRKILWQIEAYLPSDGTVSNPFVHIFKAVDNKLIADTAIGMEFLVDWGTGRLIQALEFHK